MNTRLSPTLRGPQLRVAFALAALLAILPTSSWAKLGKAEKVTAPHSLEKTIPTGNTAVFEVATRIGVTYDVYVTGVGKFDPMLSIDDGTTWADDPNSAQAIESSLLSGAGFSMKILVKGSGGMGGKFKLDIVERSTKTSAPSPGTNPAPPPPGGAPGPGTAGIARLRAGGSLPGSVPLSGKETYELETTQFEEYEIVVQPRPGSRFDVVLQPAGGGAIDLAGQDQPETYRFVAKSSSLRFTVAGRGGATGSFDVRARLHIETLAVGTTVPGSVQAGKRTTFQIQTEQGVPYGLQVLARIDPRFDPVVTVSGSAPVDQHAAGQTESVYFDGDGSMLSVDVRDRSQASGQFEIKLWEKPKDLEVEGNWENGGKVGVTRSYSFRTTAGVEYFIWLWPYPNYTAGIDLGGSVVVNPAATAQSHQLTGTGTWAVFSVPTAFTGGTASAAPYRIRLQKDALGQELVLGQTIRRVGVPPGEGVYYKVETGASYLRYRIRVQPEGNFNPAIQLQSRLVNTRLGGGVEHADLSGNNRGQGFRVNNVGSATGNFTVMVREYSMRSSAPAATGPFATCGLGFELVLVIPLLQAARARRKARRAA
ncbi:MAG: hypothetical protein JRG95_17220 [Deltaproteobacteria bacterium]|nr:hypothetical protein [Deltaproteobacteria bacterium]